MKKEEWLQAIEDVRGTPISRYVCDDSIWNDYDDVCDAAALCANPLVSVFVTTYNQSRWLRECLDSIVGQKCDFPFEVLIGEDCSTDDTFEICKEYRHRYPSLIRVFHNRHNQCGAGVMSRRRMAFARGRYIALCEGDDYWCDERKLQRQVDAIRANPGSKICYTDFLLRAGESDSFRGPIFEQSGFWNFEKELTQRDWVLENFGKRIGNQWPATASILVDADWYRSHLDSDDARAGLALGDRRLRVAAAQAGPVTVVPACCAVYRRGVGVTAWFWDPTFALISLDGFYLSVLQGWDWMNEAERARVPFRFAHCCGRMDNLPYALAVRRARVLLRLLPRLGGFRVRTRFVFEALALLSGERNLAAFLHKCLRYARLRRKGQGVRG